jgi:hypothetical protein
VRGTVKADALPEQTLTLSLNPADESPAHDTLLFNNPQPVQASYEEETIVVKANPWQNAGNPLDVNASGTITTLDALVIVNRLNLQGPAVLPPPGESIPTDNPPTPLFPSPFYDVNGDGRVTVLDALTVINFLNSRTSGGLSVAGEAALAAATPTIATPSVPSASAQSNTSLASSLDVTPLAISVAGSGSTAMAPVLAATQPVKHAADAALASAVANLFATDDQPMTAKPAIALAVAPQAEVLDELLAEPDRWYDPGSGHRRAKLELPNATRSESEWILEYWEQDADDQNNHRSR